MKQSTFVQLATFLLACHSLQLSTAQIPFQPATIEMRVVENNGVCTPDSTLHLQLANDVKEIFNSRLHRYSPGSSCADIYQGHPSGYYWLNVTNEPQLVYCSLNENRCCGESDGKWMRIAFLNMSDPSEQCPDGWREVLSPIRTCRRQLHTNINSVNYTSYGIPYSMVCGRIIAHQFGNPDGFLGYNNQNQRTLDDAYVDAISVTFGHPRNHILWTFAAEKGICDNQICSCSGTIIAAPPFINEDYFCYHEKRDSNAFLDENPLWDGKSCVSSACCEFNNPPWFCKQLDQPTTEDIEIRLMSSAVSMHYPPPEGGYTSATDRDLCSVTIKPLTYCILYS